LGVAVGGIWGWHSVSTKLAGTPSNNSVKFLR
jgi:hypothetical protein